MTHRIERQGGRDAPPPGYAVEICAVQVDNLFAVPRCGVDQAHPARLALRDPNRLLAFEGDPGRNTFPFRVGGFSRGAVRRPGPRMMHSPGLFAGRFDNGDPKPLVAGIGSGDRTTGTHCEG